MDTYAPSTRISIDEMKRYETKCPQERYVDSTEVRTLIWFCNLFRMYNSRQSVMDENMTNNHYKN